MPTIGPASRYPVIGVSAVCGAFAGARVGRNSAQGTCAKKMAVEKPIARFFRHPLDAQFLLGGMNSLTTFRPRGWQNTVVVGHTSALTMR